MSINKHFEMLFSPVETFFAPANCMIDIDLDHLRIWIIIGFGSFAGLDQFRKSDPNRRMIQTRQ